MGKRTAFVAAVASLVVLATAPGAMAAHFGNNAASLTSMTNPFVSGGAIVNYSEGTGLFNGNVTVSGLAPGGTYTFQVRRAGDPDQTICAGTADPDGTFACAAQKLTLNGFGVAVVKDAIGTVVASGAFARRGNCRDPDQAGSQCEANAAPGQN